MLVWEDLLDRIIEPYENGKVKSHSKAQSIVSFLQAIISSTIEIYLQGSKKHLPLSGFTDTPQRILDAADTYLDDVSFDALYKDIETYVKEMEAIVGGHDMAFLKIEARFHGASKQLLYALIRRHERELVPDIPSRQEDLDYLAQLANAYHRLQHAVAILKDIAIQNGEHPDVLFLRDANLRVDATSIISDEQGYELRAITEEFVHQEEFEIRYHTGIQRCLVADDGIIFGDDGELARDILPGLVGDFYEDVTQEEVGVILQHFNRAWRDGSVRLGVLEDVLVTSCSHELPQNAANMSGPWCVNI